MNVTIINSSVVLITWEAPVFDKQNGLIRFYLLLINETETGTQRSIPVMDELQTTVSDLHPLYNYQVQVAASTVETGPFSAPVTWQLPEGCGFRECVLSV